MIKETKEPKSASQGHEEVGASDGAIVYNLAEYRMAKQRALNTAPSAGTSKAQNAALYSPSSPFLSFLDRWDAPAALILGGAAGGCALGAGLYMGSSTMNIIGGALVAMTAFQSVVHWREQQK